MASEPYTVIFEKICELACELEDVGMNTRLRKRLANAFDRAICKALSINFGYDCPDEHYVVRSVFRHAERGARDYVSLPERPVPMRREAPPTADAPHGLISCCTCGEMFAKDFPEQLPPYCPRCDAP